MATVDIARGMAQAAVHRWVCGACGRPVSYLNRRQHREWLAREPVLCKGWLPFRRECQGLLVPAEAVTR